MSSPGGFASSAAAACGGRFVVVCDARSGSGYLCNCLDRHPQLACHHELFNSDFLGSRHGVEPFHFSQQGEPLVYLEEMYESTRASAGVDNIGFKLHFRHNPAVFEHLLDDRGQRIILLSRRDKLAQWGSYRLALVTGQWTRPRDDSGLHSITRVPFKLLCFTVFLVHQHGWERHVLRCRPDCLHVNYEEIVPPGSLAPVLNFLGVDPEANLRVDSRRQFTGSSTYERFTNPRWAAFGSRIGYVVAGLIQRLGATPLVRRFTTY